MSNMKKEIITKEEVKIWMKENKKNRHWLAEQCGTGKRAVDKWFEKKNKIPAKAIVILLRLMNEAQKEEIEEKGAYSYLGVELKFQTEEMEYLKSSAREHNQTIAERCIYLMKEDIKAYAKYLEDEQKKSSDKEDDTAPGDDSAPSGKGDKK